MLLQGVQSISSLINVTSFINPDFADVRSIMKDAGYAHMGVGSATGKNKAEEAAMAAISSPLLETSIAGATGVIISITSSSDIGLDEVEDAASLVTKSAHPDANIIWGCAFDDDLEDELRVTVVATGFDSTVKAPEPAPAKKAQPSNIAQGTDIPAAPAAAAPAPEAPKPAEPAPAAAANANSNKDFWDNDIWSDIEDLFKNR